MIRFLPCAAVLVAIAVRGWLHFSTPLVQGMNGAYYLVQARSLIEKFALAIPDLPLVFVIQAVIGKLIQLVSPLSPEASVMLAVKSVDTVLPALAVIPVMLLGKAWSRDDKVDLAITALAAVLIPAGAPALMMLGDFEKNSLGLALLCTLAWGLHRWAAEPTRRRMLVVVGLLGLIGLTHIGVFGTALIFAAISLIALALTHGREGVIKVLKLSLIAAPVIALAAAVVFWKFDPARVQKLLTAFSEPTSYLGSSGMPGGGGGPMRGPPGMAGAGWMQYAPLMAFCLATVPGLVLVWLKRRTIGIANIAIITGAALTVIVLTGPWVQGDKLMRFQLNAVPLAVLCLLFTLLQIPNRWARGIPGLLVLVAAMTPSVIKLQSGARPIITQEAQQELQALAASVEDPANTLIVARHGLEWWTAWTLHTRIAQAKALTPDDWTKYKYVWFIEEKRGMNIPFGPPGGGGPPGVFGRLFGFGGPPPGVAGGGERRGDRGGPMAPPFGMMPPGAGRNGPGGRGGPMGMMGPQIPANAEILHDGEHYKLAWVREVPEYVKRRDSNPLDVLAEMEF